MSKICENFFSPCSRILEILPLLLFASPTVTRPSYIILWQMAYRMKKNNRKQFFLHNLNEFSIRLTKITYWHCRVAFIYPFLMVLFYTTALYNRITSFISTPHTQCTYVYKKLKSKNSKKVFYNNRTCVAVNWLPVSLLQSRKRLHVATQHFSITFLFLKFSARRGKKKKLLKIKRWETIPTERFIL